MGVYEAILTQFEVFFFLISRLFFTIVITTVIKIEKQPKPGAQKIYEF